MKHIFCLSGTLVLLWPSDALCKELLALEVITTSGEKLETMKWSSWKRWLPHVPSTAGFPYPVGPPSGTSGLRGREPATGQKGLPRSPVSTLALHKTRLSLTWHH